MKRLLLLVFAFAALASPAWGGGLLIGSGAGAVATCSTALDSAASTTSGNIKIDAVVRQWIATKYVAENTSSICKISLYLLRLGNPAFNISACIYSHNAVLDIPGTQIGTCSNSINASTVGTSESVVDFTVDASQTASITYWVVLKGSSYGDVSNYIQWSYTDDTTERVVSDTGGDGTWEGVPSTSRSGKYQLYGN